MALSSHEISYLRSQSVTCKFRVETVNDDTVELVQRIGETRNEGGRHSTPVIVMDKGILRTLLM